MVETDGRVAHPLEERWRDHHRDNAAIVDGLVTLRYSWTDVTQRPCLVAAEVAAALTPPGLAWRASIPAALPAPSVTRSERGAVCASPVTTNCTALAMAVAGWRWLELGLRR